VLLFRAEQDNLVVFRSTPSRVHSKEHAAPVGVARIVNPRGHHPVTRYRPSNATIINHQQSTAPANLHRQSLRMLQCGAPIGHTLICTAQPGRLLCQLRRGNPHVCCAS
jgi:hypothetical protein